MRPGRPWARIGLSGLGETQNLSKTRAGRRGGAYSWGHPTRPGGILGGLGTDFHNSLRMPRTCDRGITIAFVHHPTLHKTWLKLNLTWLAFASPAIFGAQTNNVSKS